MKLKSAKDIVATASLFGFASDEHTYRVAHKQVQKARKQERINRKKGRKTNGR